jgi:hypothetical protein
MWTMTGRQSMGLSWTNASGGQRLARIVPCRRCGAQRLAAGEGKGRVGRQGPHRGFQWVMQCRSMSDDGK